MKLWFLGGALEVGRSAVVLETDSGERLVLDYGIKIGKPTSYPPKIKEGLDAAIVSHAHLDHSGFLPALYDNMKLPTICTSPTSALTSLLLKDSVKLQPDVPFRSSSLTKTNRHFSPIPYGHPVRIGRTSITLHDAGHVTGSSMIEVSSHNKRLLYTGDFKLERTRMESGAKPPKDVDVLITESTYSNREHPPRRDLERQLMNYVKTTLEEGGNVILPSFAVGRSQELLSILYANDRSLKVYLDGMAKEASHIVSGFPPYVADFTNFSRALDWVEWIDSREQRATALREPSVIVTTSGMLEGGPILHYLPRLKQNSRILLTGYCVEKTNGWTLMNQGSVTIDGRHLKVKVPWHYLDFSAHASRSDLFRMVEMTQPKKVFCMHGDGCEKFAADLNGMGYDAYAPQRKQQFNI